MQYAAAWMRQSYPIPLNVPMTVAPAPKYGGEKGRKKGDKPNRGPDQKMTLGNDLHEKGETGPGNADGDK